LKTAIIVILAAVVPLLSSGKARITVESHTVESDEYVIHAVAAGTHIDLLCERDSPYCSPLEPGEYWMFDWTVPSIEYRGDYVCRDVDVYRIAAKANRGRKMGEYCLVEK
jgi:hypothetical protein